MGESLLAKAKRVFLAVRSMPLPARHEEVERLSGAGAEGAAVRRIVESLLKGDQAPLPFESLADDIVAARSALGTVGTASADGAGSAAASAGSRIGAYRLLEKIGEGGFGVVYLAEQEEPVRRKVALKILKLGMDTRQIVARFEAERQALAVMEHPGIAKVFDAGSTPTGRPYFVMEYCAGESITGYCDRKRMPLRQRLSLFAEVCEAVQHAHQKGLIHRDLKPSNVLVAEANGKHVPKIIDFGIAKATQPREIERSYFTEHRQLLGTPEYMSPEQAEGSQDIDTRSDVYSLGVLLYELLTGSTPFSDRELRSAAYAEIQRIIREEEPPRPSTRLSKNSATLASVAASRDIEPRRLGVLVRGELDWVVMKSLEKDRTRRYASVSEFARDIERFLADEPVAARPASAGYRLRKFTRRNRVLVAAGSAVVLSLTAGLAASTAMYANAVQAKERADDAREATARENQKFRAVNAFLTEDMLSAPNAWDGGGRDVTVASVLKTSASRVGERFGAQPDVEAAVRHTLGESYQALGMFREAQEQYDRALELRRGAANAAEDDIAESLRAQAANLQSIGRLKEAQAACDDALALFRRLHGPESRGVASTLATRADIEIAESRYKDAETTLREALRILLLLPPSERDLTAVARVTNTIGSALYYSGDLAGSEKEKLKALDLFKAALGEHSPYYAQTLNDLGAVYMGLNRLDDSRVAYERALPVIESLLGPEHQVTLVCRRSLANTLSFLGMNDEAERMLRDVITISERTLGIEHADTMGAANSLATLYLRTKRDADAAPILRSLFERSARTFGERHAETLKYSVNLGWVEYKVGNAEAAEVAFRRAVEGFDATLGPTHPDAIRSLDGYAQFLGGQQRYVESAKADEDLVVRLAKRGAPEDMDTARFYNRIGTNYLSAKDYAAARPALEKSLELCRKLVSAQDWRTGLAEGRVGECLSLMGACEAAEAALLRSLEIAKLPENLERGGVEPSTKRLVAHYERCGQPEKAKALSASGATP